MLETLNHLLVFPLSGNLLSGILINVILKGKQTYFVILFLGFSRGKAPSLSLVDLYSRLFLFPDYVHALVKYRFRMSIFDDLPAEESSGETAEVRCNICVPGADHSNSLILCVCLAVNFFFATLSNN